jgi:hypothetical protein
MASLERLMAWGVSFSNIYLNISVTRLVLFDVSSLTLLVFLVLMLSRFSSQQCLSLSQQL